MSATEPRYCPISTLHRKLRQGTGSQGRPRATVTRRLCTIAGFYQYTVEEELLEYSPAAHARRPQWTMSLTLPRSTSNELGALLVAAGLGPLREHALISLLVLNGLRVSEASGAGTEHLDLKRGHRALTSARRGGEVVTICSRRALRGRSTWPSASAPAHRCSYPRNALAGQAAARRCQAQPKGRIGTRLRPRRCSK
jgi:site-specific recombinase XerC